jgi:AcrR family transcriptional regulator
VISEGAVGEDPRVVRSKAAIVDACAELLAEEGFGGVSIEAVAARSGAAKTTIYRHWPSREALLIDAFGACAGPCGQTPDTGSLGDDIVCMLTGLAEKLADPAWCASLRSLVDAAGRDPELARLHAAFVADRRRPLTDVLERGVERGLLPAALDVDRACALLLGPLFYRAMVTREPVDEDFVRGIVEGALPALADPAAVSSS